MDRPVHRLTAVTLAAAGTAIAVAGCGRGGATPAAGPPVPVSHPGAAFRHTAAPLPPLPSSLPPGRKIVLTAAANRSSVTVRLGDTVILRLAGSPSSPWMGAGDSAPGELAQLAVERSASGGVVQVFQARAAAVVQLAARRGASCGTGSEESCDPFQDPAFLVTVKITR